MTSGLPHIAYICAGSNMGSRMENCQAGIDAIMKNGVGLVKSMSAFYKTSPVDYKDQEWFVNVVFKMETGLDPLNLLKKLKKIEKDAGRSDESVRFGPRLIDMDIIFYDDIVIDLVELVIPHPRMHKRAFVLTGFCDIDPDVVHPVLKKDVRYLLSNIKDKDQKVVKY